MAKAYLAKYGKVWEKIKDGKIRGSKLELKDGEVFGDFRQVPKPKEEDSENTSGVNKSVSANKSGKTFGNKTTFPDNTAAE